MSCQSARQLIQDSLDGMLLPSNEAELQRHLEGCEGCRRDQSSLSQAVSALEALPRMVAPAELMERMSPELDRLSREASPRRRMRAWIPAGAIAAGLLVGLALNHQLGSDPLPARTAAVAPQPDLLAMEPPSSEQILQWVDASADPMEILPF